MHCQNFLHVSLALFWLAQKKVVIYKYDPNDQLNESNELKVVKSRTSFSGPSSIITLLSTAPRLFSYLDQHLNQLGRNDTLFLKKT